MKKKHRHIFSHRKKTIIFLIAIVIIIPTLFIGFCLLRPNSVSDLELVLTSDKASYQINMSIIITLTLTNKGSLLVGLCDVFSSGESILISVTDPDGFKVDSYLKPVLDKAGCTSYRILYPSNSLYYSFNLLKIDLPKIGTKKIDFSLTGKYELSALYELPLYSNKIYFDIVNA